MDIIKYFKDQRWIPLYIAELKNRLRKDKNLSDIANPAKAVENLGLTGEVETHTHDKRYALITDTNREIGRIDKRIDDTIINMNENQNSLNVEFKKYCTAQDFNNYKRNFHVGTTSPANPPENCIWFDTTSGRETVKVFISGQWRTFGAVWKG